MKPYALITFIAAMSNTLFAYEIPGTLSQAENQKVFSKYCTGKANSVAVPTPNYQNSTVLSAAAKLSQIGSVSDAANYYYLYPDPIKAYGLGTSGKNLLPAPEGTPEGVSLLANALLTMTCGEFRDRASMIEAKMKWYDNMSILPESKQGQIDLTKNLWTQVTTEGYLSYVQLSSAIYDMKSSARTTTSAKMDALLLQLPVAASTLCEAKFVISQLATGNVKLKFIENPYTDPKGNYQEYATALKGFASKSCTQADVDYLVDFRGDSNIKWSSPESNGMIWYSNSVFERCNKAVKDVALAKKSLEKAKSDEAKKAAEDSVSSNMATLTGICTEYRKSPFQSRWNAARAGLATWIMRDKKFDALFADTDAGIYMRPTFEKLIQSPIGFSETTADAVTYEMLPEFTSNATAWDKSDLGFNQIAGLGTTSANKTFAFERLRDAVNRHTNWYHIGYSDGKGLSPEKAYSPFVASSYEMSKSDGFTSPGATVSGGADGRKHFMYVFKIKKSNWYNSQNLIDNQQVNFDTMWFDETTLGTKGYALSERAFDRLGTALEDEYDAIMVLQNIQSN